MKVTGKREKPIDPRKIPYTFNPFPMCFYDRLDELNGSEIACLLVIARETYGSIDKTSGLRRSDREIAIARFEEVTGQSERTISRSLASLDSKGFIERSGSKQHNRTYRLKLAAAFARPAKNGGLNLVETPKMA